MMASAFLQKSLASGFTSWWSMWDERCRRKRVLAHAASRLKNPDLAEAFHLIVAEWQAAKNVPRQSARSGERSSVERRGSRCAGRDGTHFSRV